MHHDYRAFEQLVAQHRAGRGILRHLSALNQPRPSPAAADRRGGVLFDPRYGSDVYILRQPVARASG